MAKTQSNQIQLDEIAESFAERYRRGERPSIDQYVQQYPELAEQIRDLFPTLMMIEHVEGDLRDEAAETPQAGGAAAPITQLGDYRIVREVGRGGMGVVYEAEQVSLGRRVALKVLPKQLLSQPKLRKRFEREARAAGRLHHTNIVPVFGVGQQDGMHYYVMQFIDGLGLDEVLVELQRMRQESDAGSTKVSDGKGQGSDKQQPEHHPVGVGRATEVAQSLVRGQFEKTWAQNSSSATERDPEDSGRPRATSGHSKDVRGEQPGVECDSGATLVDSLGAAPDACRDTAAGHVSDTLAGSGALPFPGLVEGHSRSHSRSVYWRSVTGIGLQAAEALEHAHEQGIVHRDIKPANLLLDMGGCVWVTDFGLAKAADQQDLTHSGDVLGTLRYMAPEQFDGQADARSDVYSLGLTLYELLALQPGFDERERRKLIKQVTSGTPARLRTVDARIPRDLETIVHKAIDRDPAHRYPTAGQLAADLQRYLDDEPIKAKWISPVVRMHRWCKRNPAIATLTSAIAFLLVSAAVASSVTALRFQNLAGKNARLAANLTTALSDAQVNLKLAATERQRAEGNLDLSLNALDAVYLDAIGTEKLLGQPRSKPQAGNADFTPSAPAPLSDLEKELLKRGLKFYDQFAQQNAGTPQAAVQTAQAYYRVGLLQAALGDHSAAESAYSSAVKRFEQLVIEQPKKVEYHRRLAESYGGLSRTIPDWDRAKPFLERALGSYTAAIALSPKEPMFYSGRAGIYLQIGNMTEFDNDAAKAADLDPRNLRLQVDAAIILSYRSPARARPYAERALEMDPNNATAHMAMARSFPSSKKEHLTHLSKAIEINPESPRAYQLRADYFRKVGRLKESLSDVDRSLELNPDSFGTLLASARTRTALSRYEEAEQHLEGALKINPNRAVAYAEYGNLRLAQKRYEDAVDKYNQAIAHEAGVWYWHKRRAEALFRLDRFEKSLADLREAFEIKPSDLSTLVWIQPQQVAECPEESFKQGVLDLATAAIDHPDVSQPLALLYRAQHLLAREEWEKAERDLTRASELAADDAKFQIRLAHQYRGAGREQQALTCFSRTLDLNPSNAHHWNNRGMCYHRLGQHEEARDDYSEAIERDPNVAAFWSNRALSQLRLQAHQEAVDDAYKAIELKPKHTLAHKWRAQAHAALQHWPEAIADYTKLIELEPKHSGHLLKRGQARLAAGDDAGAEEDFEAYLRPLELAVNKNPEDWQVWNRRGVALTKLERWEAAIADFQKAAELAPEERGIYENWAANLVQQERWADAAATLANLVELGAEGWRPNYELALCYLGAGDMAQYRDVCTRMLEDGVRTDDPLRASFTAWTCALTPDAVDDYQPLVAAASNAAEQSPDNPQFQNSLGAVLYRAGRFNEATEKLEELIRINESNARANSSPAYTWYFLAMTHHALGHADEAQAVLARANEWTDNVLSDETDPPAWNRRLSLQLLREEANTQIEVEKSRGPGQEAERPASPPPSAETKP